MTATNRALALLILSFCSCNFFSSPSELATFDERPRAASAPDREQLAQEVRVLQSLSYHKAIEQLGKPREVRLIKALEAQGINQSVLQRLLVASNDEPGPIMLLEASWLLQEQSWVMVWYRRIEGKWMPIDLLVSV